MKKSQWILCIICCVVAIVLIVLFFRGQPTTPTDYTSNPEDAVNSVIDGNSCDITNSENSLSDSSAENDKSSTAGESNTDFFFGNTTTAHDNTTTGNGSATTTTSAPAKGVDDGEIDLGNPESSSDQSSDEKDKTVEEKLQDPNNYVYGTL